MVMRIDICKSLTFLETRMTAAAADRRARSAVSGKRAIKLSPGSGVLEAARQRDINISQVCDQHLREVVRREQERRWRAEQADFVAAYNATLDADGLPLDVWRRFRWGVSMLTPTLAAVRRPRPICWMCKAICLTDWAAGWWCRCAVSSTSRRSQAVHSPDTGVVDGG